MGAGRADGKGLLPHLSGGGAPVRQVIAAHYLRGCTNIVEIGGAGLPITGFITHRPETITVFDPKIAPWQGDMLNGSPCQVAHRPEKFQAASLAQLCGLPSLGVALLGLSLKPLGSQGVVSDDLLALLRTAAVVVLEHSITLRRALEQAPLLLDQSGLAEVVTIDLTIRDGVLEKAGHSERRLTVLARHH
jgi:hypothetical protein